MSTQHIIHGKPTTHGHMAHYIDDNGKSHAAIITNITVHPDSGDHLADLHVFHRDASQGTAIKNVPYNRYGEPNTWQHLPY
jgi:hypothetical protein